MFARGEGLSVLGMEIRVMALEDVMATKLMALTEHSLRYEGLLQSPARCASRSTGRACAPRPSSPFARAFFVLLEGLEILPSRRPRPRTRVRVVTPQGSTATQGG